jgi:hypothetical protein
MVRKVREKNIKYERERERERAAKQKSGVIKVVRDGDIFTEIL